MPTSTIEFKPVVFTPMNPPPVFSVGVSCRCGTCYCNGEKCNPVEFELAVMKQKWNFSIDELWQEFLMQCTEDSHVPKTMNFLGSVDWYKMRFDKAVQHLRGK